jgi:hypothetical protein
MPSRFYDESLPDGVGRSIDLCYEVESNGDRARTDVCSEATAEGTILDMLHTDVRSPFNGADRFVDINSNRISNREGPKIWYTDPFGHNASTQPFPGSITQFIASIDNDRGLRISGPTIGRDRDYGATTVHSPN